MRVVDVDAPIRFIRSGYESDDWIAVLLKSPRTGEAMQRVVPVATSIGGRFQGWLRYKNAHGWHVYVSVNAVHSQHRARTREAIGNIRHVFLDADEDGVGVLAAIAARPDLPRPSCVLHSSPNRRHVLWRVAGFTTDSAERLQKQLARELGTDTVATSCAQVTRLPGFCNHKYRPAPLVVAEYGPFRDRYRPSAFPTMVGAEPQAPSTHTARDQPPMADVRQRAQRYVAAIPPAVAGHHGDTTTFQVCCRLVRGFALHEEDALMVLAEWNEACSPPWSQEELRAKLRNARRYGREPVGGLLSAPGAVTIRKLV